MARLPRDPNYKAWRDLSIQERRLRKWKEAGRPRWLWISKRYEPSGRVSGMGTCYIYPRINREKLENHENQAMLHRR